jgi:signal transduction histidine kinase
MTATDRRRVWRYLRGLLPPALFIGLLAVALAYAVRQRLQAEQQFDEAALREWIKEARAPRDTLSDLLRNYLEGPTAEDDPDQYSTNVNAIREHLRVLGNVTKMYQTHLPLFPQVYRLEVVCEPARPAELVWDSQLPHRDARPPTVIGLYDHNGQKASLRVYAQLHAWDTKQQVEARNRAIFRWGGILAVVGGTAALVWIGLFLRRERERELAEFRARQQLVEVEKRALENELRRQEAERKHEEMERRLLEQRIATQEAEGRALQLKSQLYAGIGIMAGSYAHNIKNLLVRPNDLLRRCIEADGMSPGQQEMLLEVRHTLHTVTERLQQILKTVRRDPSHAEPTRIDLNEIVLELKKAWEDMAAQKWKLQLAVQLHPEPLIVLGDRSHLTQAAENLLFNARDATFEMRNHVREQARRGPHRDEEDKRKALIGAAAWKGAVVLRTRLDRDRPVLEVVDNGVGMTDEVRRRCLEPHFTTKRDNALYEGNFAGMGLGLSFVQAVADNHRARLEIVTQPLQGALFRLSFPPAAAAAPRPPESPDGPSPAGGPRAAKES